MSNVRPYTSVIQGSTQVVIVLLFILSLTSTILNILPAANNLYWPAVAVSMELWPWLIAINLLGLLFVRLRYWTVAAVFVLGLIIAAWPLFTIPSLTASADAQWKEHYAHTANSPGTGQLFLASFTNLAVPTVLPEKLESGILFYGTPNPTSSNLKPIVIDIHGGGWHYGSPNDDDVFSRILADKGYAVFSIPYRLAPEFTFPTQLDDVKKSIAWIHTNAVKFGADSARIVLIGRSAGGNLALLAGYDSPDIKISGIISFYPATDLKEMYNDPPEPDPHHVPLTIAEFLGGTPDQVPEKYRLASPITFVATGLPPTLQLQGSRDKIQQSKFPRALHEELIKRGNVSILVELPWAHHSFDFVYFCPGGQLARHYIEQFLSETFESK